MRWPLSRKFVLGLSMLAVILIIVLIFTTSTMYRGNLEKQYSDKAFTVAQTIAYSLDGDEIERYLETLETDDHYWQIYDYFKNVMTQNGIEYVYVSVQGEEGGTYVWNVPSADEEVTDLNKLGAYEEYWSPEAAKVALNAFKTGTKTDNIQITRSDSYGYIASAYCPVFDSQGNVAALAGVDINMEEIEAQLNSFILWLVLTIVIVVVLFVSLYLMFLRRTLIKPLEKLTSRALGFASGGSLVKFENDIHSGDELQLLSEAFQKMAADIDRYSNNLASSAADRERVATELNVAARIQISMLPDDTQRRDDFELRAKILPAKVVGGDFYDYFMLDRHRLAFVVADISGKGVSAALFKYHLQSGDPLEKVMSDVNAQLCENNEEELYVTAFVGILDLDTGTLTYVNAGHPAPFLMRDGEKYLSVKGRTGFVLAAVGDVKFREAQLSLRQGDRLFIYSTGLSELFSPDGAMFGSDGILEALNSSRRDNPTPAKTIEYMVGACEKFSGGAEILDDMTILVLENLLGSKKMRELKVDGELRRGEDVLLFIKRQLDENDISIGIQSLISSAVEDIFVNIVSGAKIEPGEKITVKCRIEDSGPEVVIEFTYAGAMYNPFDGDAGTGKARMNVIRANMAKVSYDGSDGTNRLTIVKKL